MENNNTATFKEIEQIYKEMNAELTKKKHREYDKIWRRQRYIDDPMYRDKCKERANLSYYNKKQSQKCEQNTSNI